MEPTLMKDILNSVIPESEVNSEEKSFMSIAGIEHLENIWSNIYAYYLDANESHGLASIFLQSLQRLIMNKSGRHFNLSGCRIVREQSTNNGNRIDILIHTHDQSVIIENKVFHTLNNDLNDYWFSVCGKDDSKIGIVLTLHPVNINNPHYINLTHLEWISAVENEIVLNSISLKTEIAILFYDFIDTIKRVSGKMKESDMRFYLQNRFRINELHSVATKYRNWLQSIFTDKSFVKSLGNFDLVHSDRIGSIHRYAMYQIAGTDELVITVYYEPLWNSKPGEARLCLYLEPLGGWLKKAINRQEQIRTIAEAHGVPSMEINKGFWHCASVEIDVPELALQSEEKLKGYIARYLHDSCSSLMTAAREIVDVLSETHIPSYQWEEAAEMLLKLLPRENGENIEFWCSPIEYISFDPVNKIVVLEVLDNLFRSTIECRYDRELSSAIKYAFGDDARYTILCRQLVF